MLLDFNTYGRLIRPMSLNIRFLSVRLRFRYCLFSPIPHDMNLTSRFRVRLQTTPLVDFHRRQAACPSYYKMLSHKWLSIFCFCKKIATATRLKALEAIRRQIFAIGRAWYCCIQPTSVSTVATFFPAPFSMCHITTSTFSHTDCLPLVPPLQNSQPSLQIL